MMALTQKHRKQLYDSLNYVKAAFLRILMLLKTFGSETERERERACVRACLRALLQYKALDAVLYKWPYL